MRGLRAAWKEFNLVLYEVVASRKELGGGDTMDHNFDEYRRIHRTCKSFRGLSLVHERWIRVKKAFQRLRHDRHPVGKTMVIAVIVHPVVEPI